MATTTLSMILRVLQAAVLINPFCQDTRAGRAGGTSFKITVGMLSGRHKVSSADQRIAFACIGIGLTESARRQRLPSGAMYLD
jgi:hypothetical protein